MPIHKKVNKDFFKKWSHDMAYVLGFFAADGYMTVNKRGGHFWCIRITDEKLLNEIRKLIESNHKINIRIGKGNHSTSYGLQIGSKEMFSDLYRLGMRQNKTKSLSVPHIPKKYLPNFVRGYFDGDGNVWSGYLHKHRRTKTLSLQVCFTSCSIEFLKNVLDMLRGCGIRGGSVYHSKNGNYARLMLSTLDALKLYEIMYNNPCNLYLDRKRSVFQRFIKMRL